MMINLRINGEMDYVKEWTFYEYTVKFISLAIEDGTENSHACRKEDFMQKQIDGVWGPRMGVKVSIEDVERLGVILDLAQAPDSKKLFLV
ncbi:hypothetical protein Tco_0312552 [Tanacetum coccineum]